MLELRQKQTGFTIVELIIVIVVIAIVASIATVGYRGIRERAITAAYTSAVEQWDELIKIQVARHGPLPLTGLTCLGRASTDFPARDGFAAGECVRIESASSGSSASYSHNDAYFDALRINQDMFDGLLPLTNFALQSIDITYRSRGVLLMATSTTYSLALFPQVSGQCGRGVSAGGSEAGLLTGDYCILQTRY